MIPLPRPPPSTSNSSSGGSTTSTCNQGILLNSQITGTTIFDEPLYVIDYDYKVEESAPLKLAIM